MVGKFAQALTDLQRVTSGARAPRKPCSLIFATETGLTVQFGQKMAEKARFDQSEHLMTVYPRPQFYSQWQSRLKKPTVQAQTPCSKVKTYVFKSLFLNNLESLYKICTKRRECCIQQPCAIVPCGCSQCYPQQLWTIWKTSVGVRHLAKLLM